MSRSAVVAAAFLAAACAGERAVGRLAPAFKPGDRQSRVGVLPFSDKGGRGRDVAVALSKALWRRHGFDPVDVAQLEATFANLGLRLDETFTPQDLAAVRASTFADALIVGSIDTAPRRGSVDGPGSDRGASLLILDTRSGETLASLVLPASAVAGRRPDEVADAFSKGLAAELRARGFGFRHVEERTEDLAWP